MNRTLTLLTLLCVASIRLSGQAPLPSPEQEPAPVQSTDDYRMSKSPTAAILWGLVPGGGQVYTEQYWKVPVFVLPIGAFLGLGIHYDAECRNFDDLATSIGADNDGYSAAIASREAARDNRDVMYAFAGGVWILSLVDAYVGAHLFDFDVGDSLAIRSIRVYPTLDRPGIAATYRW